MKNSEFGKGGGLPILVAANHCLVLRECKMWALDFPFLQYQRDSKPSIESLSLCILVPCYDLVSVCRLTYKITRFSSGASVYTPFSVTFVKQCCM